MEELLDRTPSYTLRWHNKPTRLAENCAEHHYYTAYYTLLLGKLAQQADWDVDLLTALSMALVHDAPERVTGDVPGSLKRLYEGVREQVQQWELQALPLLWVGCPPDLQSLLRSHVRRYITGTVLIETSIAQFADLFAVYSFLHDEVAIHGNEALQEVRNYTAEELLHEWENIAWCQSVAEKVDNSIGKHLHHVVIDARLWKRPGGF